MDSVAVLATAVWAMLPAYLPNNVAVVAGGGRPVDGGRMWRGKRLLGDGKTWRGSVLGILAGVVVAVLLNRLVDGVSSGVGVPLPGFPWVVAVALPVGAMAGDLAASALKRRFDRDRGTSVPLLDQLDFVVGAVVVTVAVAPGWAGEVFSLAVVATIVVVTPILHLLTNMLAYALGLKSVPW